jgi:glycogen phosphorylase
VPVYFLDTDLPDNPAWERTLTNNLYGGDEKYRLCQEAVLGIAGVRKLRALGYKEIARLHMNEGHSALLTLALLEEIVGRPNLASATNEEIEAVRRQCVFTTHTPVPAAFDQFPLEIARRVLGQDRVGILDATRCCPFGNLNYAQRVEPARAGIVEKGVPRFRILLYIVRDACRSERLP